MRVVFIASECEPWAKVGGLGDVVDALARALEHVPGALDEPVEVFLPRYRSVPLPVESGTTRVVPVPDPRAADGTSEVAIRTWDVAGYRLRLVDHPPAFDRDGVYGPGASDYPDNAWRFALLARAALETRRVEGRPLDVIALHEWHACAAVLQRDLVYADDPVVGPAAVTLTIHNLAYQGWLPREQVVDLGLGPDPAAGDARGLNLLGEGIRRADAVNTVSPGYAREVLGAELGRGLEGDLRARGAIFGGILNGLDQRLWDPASDGAIAVPYDASDLAGKAACRADLCHRVGFDAADPRPDPGRHRAPRPAEGLRPRGGRRAGPRRPRGADRRPRERDTDLVAGVRAAAADAPDRIAMVEHFDRDLARRIYAGADIFLMPSRFEPCGQGQMIAMRYGTPPVARRTGGLGDTIVDVHEDPGERDRLPLRRGDARRAPLRLRAGDRRPGPTPARWDGLVRRAMAVDWAWERASAPAYAAMFRRAIAVRRPRGPGGAEPADLPGRPRLPPARLRSMSPALLRSMPPASRRAVPWRPPRRRPTVNPEPSGAISNAARAGGGASRRSRRTASARQGAGAVRASQSSVSWRKRHSRTMSPARPGPGEHGPPVRRAQRPPVGRVAKDLDGVEEGVETGVLGRDEVDEHEPPRRPEDAGDLARGPVRRVGPVVDREAADRQVERRVREGQGVGGRPGETMLTMPRSAARRAATASISGVGSIGVDPGHVGGEGERGVAGACAQVDRPVGGSRRERLHHPGEVGPSACDQPVP